MLAGFCILSNLHNHMFALISTLAYLAFSAYFWFLCLCIYLLTLYTLLFFCIPFNSFTHLYIFFVTSLYVIAYFIAYFCIFFAYPAYTIHFYICFNPVAYQCLLMHSLTRCSAVLCRTVQCSVVRTKLVKVGSKGAAAPILFFRFVTKMFLFSAYCQQVWLYCKQEAEGRGIVSSILLVMHLVC